MPSVFLRCCISIIRRSNFGRSSPDMFLQTARKFASRIAPATLALLVSAICAPSQAEASCGDYVMVGGRHAGMSNHSSGAGHDMHDPAAAKCHGPSCSNGSIPPLAPVPKIEVTVERWAIPGQTGLSGLPESDFLLADTQAMPCDGFGLSILRPPR